MMMHQSEPAPLLKEASLGREFPKSFETMIQRMLQKAPHQRFQDLTSVIEALNAAATDGKTVEISPLKPKAEPKQAKLISLSVSKLYGLVLAAVITSSALTASVMYHWQKTQEQIQVQKHAQMPAPTADKIQDQTGALAGDRELSNLIKLSEPDKKVDWSITAAEMKPRLIDTAEGKQKLLHFPKEPIGKVSNHLAGELCDWKFPYHDLMAVGDVRMPADIPLTLEVSASAHPAAYNSPEIFGKIDPAEFSELLLRGSPMNDINKESKGLAGILSYAKKWTNLVSLGLYSVSVQKDAIDQINQMKKIRYLLIEGDAIAGAGAIKHEFLSRLKYLMIIQNPRDVSAADKIFSYIAGSSNFEQLELQRTSVSPTAIDKLRSCPNLTKVTLIGAVHETEKYRTISDELLNAFLKLPKLKTLELKCIDVSPEQFKTIAGSTVLKKIVVSSALMPSFRRSGCNDARFAFKTK
jgi:hypothetical protein